MCVLLGAAGLTSAALVFGFFVFATATTDTAWQPQAEEQADAIVVLTGGARRMRTAGQLLQEERGRQLLVSGVNRAVTRQAVARLLGVGAKLFRCCVTIDYAAQNTRGNANETRKWVRKHSFKRLIVVTASYHMPRSLVELGRVVPEVDLVAHPVLPDRFRDRPWWLDPRDASLLAAEYLKFLPAAAHYAIERAVETPGRDSGGQEHKAIAVQ
jgi:uncharacterized SAM-binding protein YcdF (DUF218 family)